MLLPLACPSGIPKVWQSTLCETSPEVDVVVFDKTCTLIEGLMSLSDVVADEDEARFLT
jgi:cation transport ATPase